MRFVRARDCRQSSVVEFSGLESRTLMCADHGGVAFAHTLPAPSGWATGAAGTVVPVLNSKVGAKATLYLDFDGEAATTWGSFNVSSTPAYTGSSSNIQEIFARVAEKFSSFDINVTTVNPGSFANQQALRVVIGGDGAWTGVSCGGLSYVGSFYNGAPNTAYVFPVNLGAGFPKYVAEAVCHEAGHAFGLQHQSEYSITHSAGGDTTNKTQEYSDNGGNPDVAPTMGNSYGSTRGTWWYGTSSTGDMQNDLSVIAGSANGFGFRADDHGSSFANARNMKFNSTDRRFNVRGTIEKTSDTDRFAFNFPGGKLTLKVRVANFGATLDSVLRIYNANGVAVAKADSVNLGEQIIKTLPAGKYYAIVSSEGNAGDVGQYTLIATYSGPAASMTAAPTTGATPSTAPVFSTTPIASSSTSSTSYADIEAALVA
jgi:hypothetical protein